MSVKISVIGPVLNEVDYIGYSVMAAKDFVHEFIYSLDEASSDGTRELLYSLSQSLPKGKLRVIETPTFHPSNTERYNAAFNDAISMMTGDAAFFLHPDMIITSFPKEGLKEGPLAWFIHIASYAGDMTTRIAKGRCGKWKNIHMNRFGLHYFGKYGDDVEDFYHRDITGNAHVHHGTRFDDYPFEVADSGVFVNHYCELKSYKRRYEKMKSCLRSQFPHADEEWVKQEAAHHPRVTLSDTSRKFGEFAFEKSDGPVPSVFSAYKSEFEPYRECQTKGVSHG